MSTTAASSRSGFVYAFSAYGLWGLLPLYFLVLSPPSGAWEIVSMRILLSLAVCAVLLGITRNWRVFFGHLRSRRTSAAFALAGVLVWVNWTVYVLAALSGHVVEAALGYFINPLVTISLGVIFLREKLRPLQWVAVGVAVLAVLVLTVAYGQMPIIALVLAFSFGLYGFVKKQAGPQIDAVSGLTLETLWLTPFAAVQLVVMALTGQSLTLIGYGLGHTVLLLLAGVITATPLLFFAAATRRIPLVYLGLIQFMAPILQFIVAVVVLREAMPVERLAGFIIVWIACALLIVDALHQGRNNRRIAAVGEIPDEVDPLATADR